MSEKWNENCIKLPKQEPTSKRWSVYGLMPDRDKNGKRKRVRKSFKTQEEAIHFRKNKIKEARRIIGEGTERHTRLSAKQEAEYSNAIRSLENAFPDQVLPNLVDVVEYYNDNFSTGDVKRTLLADGITHYTSDLNFLNNSKVHRDQFSRRLKNFGTAYDGKFLDQIKRDTIVNWLKAKRRFDENEEWVNQSEIRNEHACLRAFFNHCVREKLLRVSPMADMKAPDVDMGEVVILSNDEVRALLREAQAVDAGSTMPYFIMATFLSIRPEEIQRLDWKSVHLGEEGRHGCGVIKVKGKGKGRTRQVAVNPTAKAWLLHYQLDEGPICSDNHRKKFNLVRALAGYRIARNQLEWIDLEGREEELEDVESDKRPKWINDVLRKTGITHYVQYLDEDAGKVARWAGNSVKVIDDHYLSVDSVDTIKDMEEFYGILPPEVDDCIEFKAS